MEPTGAFRGNLHAGHLLLVELPTYFECGFRRDKGTLETTTGKAFQEICNFMKSVIVLRLTREVLHTLQVDNYEHV